MVGAPSSTKTFYEAKHALKVFTIVKTTNSISSIIIAISSPQ
jgi:hypothetical protein